MFRRREISRVDPAEVGLSGPANLGNAVLLDHLFPKTQMLLHEAKKFKIRFGYACCWTKISVLILKVLVLLEKRYIRMVILLILFKNFPPKWR